MNRTMARVTGANKFYAPGVAASTSPGAAFGVSAGATLGGNVDVQATGVLILLLLAAVFLLPRLNL